MLSLSALAGDAGGESVRVRMTTDLGVVDIDINIEAAPVSANNFLRLVDGGHMDGTSFYRVVSPENDNGSPPISVIQGGNGSGDSPFEAIAHESTEDTGLLHLNGAISMARGDVGTASTEFFICIGAQPALDFAAQRNPDGQGFAVFGYVVGGMDVVQAIHQQPSDAPTESAYLKGQMLEEPVTIISIRRAVSDTHP
ncbi:MAG: peptidylprolyl isomerase [Gammaproteobacteria bacterium]|nr:peptidylprolyl isomerase [Gammaproteobacteria bacterium]